MSVAVGEAGTRPRPAVGARLHGLPAFLPSRPRPRWPGTAPIVLRAAAPGPRGYARVALSRPAGKPGAAGTPRGPARRPPRPPADPLARVSERALPDPRRRHCLDHRCPARPADAPGAVRELRGAGALRGLP